MARAMRGKRAVQRLLARREPAWMRIMREQNDTR
jgi:hypothetical protein